MATPYISELKIFSFGFAPKGWALANGQTLPISQNQALFSLLGTTYGGNGQTTFQLPNLQGRVPLHFGNGFSLGQTAGEESHTLLLSEIPAHTHSVGVSNAAATSASPSSSTLAVSTAEPYAAFGASLVDLNAATVAPGGGSEPHENRQPFLVLNVCIALQGIFPSRN